VSERTRGGERRREGQRERERERARERAAAREKMREIQGKLLLMKSKTLSFFFLLSSF